MLVEKKLYIINPKILLNNLKSRKFIIIFFDLSVCLFSLWIAFFLRLDKFYSLKKYQFTNFNFFIFTNFFNIFFFKFINQLIDILD